MNLCWPMKFYNWYYHCWSKRVRAIFEGEPYNLEITHDFWKFLNKITQKSERNTAIWENFHTLDNTRTNHKSHDLLCSTLALFIVPSSTDDTCTRKPKVSLIAKTLPHYSHKKKKVNQAERRKSMKLHIPKSASFRPFVSPRTIPLSEKRGISLYPTDSGP